MKFKKQNKKTQTGLVDTGGGMTKEETLMLVNVLHSQGPLIKLNKRSLCISYLLNAAH